MSAFSVMATSAAGTSSSAAGYDEHESSEEVETESESQQRGTPPPTKRKKYACIFRANLTKVFPWVRPSKKGATYAFCTKCNRDISLGKGGSKDLRRHEQTSLHSQWDRASSSLEAFFGPSRVVEAEIKFDYFIGEHHLPFLLADHCTKVFSFMFPDSVIARGFKCSRTKAMEILKVIAQDVRHQNVDTLRDSKFFSLQVDETTDISITQQMAIMLRFFDNKLGRVQCFFFALESVQRATGELLFEAIDKHFQNSVRFCYDNLIGLGTDGANVMLGQRNSVLSRLRLKQANIVSLHCNCHIAALIANYACKVLPDNLEELTTDVYYYFQKSPKRIREFKQFQVFVESKPHKLRKACQTRWLSLEACVNRLLEQYQALISYFRSTEDKQAVVRRVNNVLDKPLTKAYLLFLSTTLPIINTHAAGIPTPSHP